MNCGGFSRLLRLLKRKRKEAKDREELKEEEEERKEERQEERKEERSEKVVNFIKQQVLEIFEKQYEKLFSLRNSKSECYNPRKSRNGRFYDYFDDYPDCYS